MKYNSYEEYKTAALDYYSKKDIKINVELMILPEALFNTFDGIIEFGPGGSNLVNKPKHTCKCDCKVKCANHVE